jgi:TPR repeat protein
MENAMRRLLIVVALVFAHPAVAGDFEDGVAAYQRKDYATTLAKFRSAAQQGNAAAQALVGMMYNEGLGIAQDYKEAERWYRLAAQQGYADAQYNLGVMYKDGQGVAQDYKEAVRWWRMAAKQGNANAQYNLGVMYLRGQGVLQDYLRAHMWSNISAVNGDKDSVENRNVAASKMTPQQIDQAQRMARECMASNFKKCD